MLASPKGRKDVRTEGWKDDRMKGRKDYNEGVVISLDSLYVSLIRVDSIDFDS